MTWTCCGAGRLLLSMWAQKSRLPHSCNGRPLKSTMTAGHCCLVCWHAGGMLGGLSATSIGSRRPLDIDGWRFAFHLMAAVSILCGLLVSAAWLGCESVGVRAAEDKSCKC